MAAPGTLGQFHALLESPSGIGLSACGTSTRHGGEMCLLLRFSDEDVEWAMAVPEAGGLWKDGFCFGGRYLFLFAHLFLFNI